MPLSIEQRSWLVGQSQFPLEGRDQLLVLPVLFFGQRLRRVFLVVLGLGFLIGQTGNPCTLSIRKARIMPQGK